MKTPTTGSETMLAHAVAECDAALAEAHQAQRQAEQRLAAAGLTLMHAVAVASAIAKQDRRTRTSCASHIERLLDRGGEIDLEKFQRTLEEQRHLRPASTRALGHAEGLVPSHFRTGGAATVDEDALRRMITNYNETDFNSLGSELSGIDANAFHVVALAFQRVGLSHPEFFGTLFWQDEAAEIEQANALLAKAAETLHSSPTLRRVLAEHYGVVEREEIRGGVRVPLDMTKDLLDAAAARGPRG